MTRTLTDNVLTPLYLFYYFFRGMDFRCGGKRNYYYFVINLILSFIISICSFIYNEFMILFCCGLEENTHDQITERALTIGTIDNDEGLETDSNVKDEDSER